MKPLVIHIWITACLLMASTQLARAQTDVRLYDYPQNHLEWYTVESEHFLVHFQKGNSRSAKVVSRIAEEVYTPITELYQHEPDEKVSIVLKDREDYSNGAAYFFDNKIDIWVPALESPLRGTHNWLRNVIAHEFVHIVQIQKGMKRSRKIPAFYFQWLSYEDVRRPDVLYGFPNGLITFPFATVNVPAWFAEGTAQYQTSGLFYDTWDSHRDMILRSRILTDTPFTLDEMGTFSSKNSLERETVYTMGYAFVIHLADTFGEDILRDITEALGQKGVYDISTAMKIATGVPGHELYNNWINELKIFYQEALKEITPSPSHIIEERGFFNFYPQSSPYGEAVAYLSNKGFDSSILSLYIKRDEEPSEEIALVSELSGDNDQLHLNLLEKRLLFLESSISYDPSGKKIAYATNKRNSYGEFYRDVFIYDLDNKESKRLTNSGRVQFPSWSHGGTRIAAVQNKGGTQNLVLLYTTAPDSITQITNFSSGETVSTPTWSADDRSIYFASSNLGNRNIYKVELETFHVSPILEDEYIDYRDPHIGSKGKYLYFSANTEGIHNIYRSTLEGHDLQKLTSVMGGAFMPAVSNDGTLYFSEYVDNGYQVKSADLKLLLEYDHSGTYYLPFPDGEYDYEMPDPYVQKLNQFNDSDINPFDSRTTIMADTGSYSFILTDLAGSDVRTFRKYENTYTGFSFFPVLRFDNYSKKYGSNGSLIKNGYVGKVGQNLVRDAKVGTYFSSRDVIDRLSIFGGLMVGPASQPIESIGGFFRPDRLFGLDRDAFFIAEHRGLPFIEKSWSPTVAIEVYNMRRNVSDGLSIEEFPCTSCLPDTTYTDIAYNIWEAGVFLRSKLNRRSMLELGISYSPYRVSTDGFYSRELQQQVSGNSSEYFKGTTLSASYTFDYYLYSNDADIAPLGLKGYFRYQYQPSKLLEEYEIEDGALSPVFNNQQNHSTELHLRYGIKTIGDQALQARIRGFHYFNDPDDSFYADYIGGFMGMRSYPYFALGGSTTAFSSLSWFSPLWRDIHSQKGPFLIDKIFARFFFETGNGWRSPFDTGQGLKSGLGAELRIAMNGYYLFPLKFFVSGSYGFDQFTLSLPDAFITNSGSNQVTYGRELLFHFGLTFDFELL